MTLYHGTNKKDGNEDVVKFKNKELEIKIPNVLRLNYSSKKCKLPGSLGYGYYTFENDKEMAYYFSKKKFSEPTVLEVQVDKDFKDDHGLDFKDEKDRDLFWRFIRMAGQDVIGKNILRKLERMHSLEGISAKQDVFAGIMTELFIRYATEKNGKVIQMVRKDTETFLPPYDNPKYRFGLPNGTEVCIRDANCIKAIDIISLS